MDRFSEKTLRVVENLLPGLCEALGPPGFRDGWFKVIEGVSDTDEAMRYPTRSRRRNSRSSSDGRVYGPGDGSRSLQNSIGNADW